MGVCRYCTAIMTAYYFSAKKEAPTPMAHITLPEGVPGISGPMMQYPDTAQHLRGLADALLHAPSSLTPGERETIAALVSSRNHCIFCMLSHAAVAYHHREAEGGSRYEVDTILKEGAEAAPTPKMKALLAIAAEVQKDGKGVTEEMVARARAEGADDRAIHDTILIAAAFCMYNRYVDGLGTMQPTDPALYEQMGAMLAKGGYARREAG